MATVHTATGPIDSADLGNVLVHEHVFVVGEEFRQNIRTIGTRTRRSPKLSAT